MERLCADKLIMLLSTDWFFEYWPLIGLCIEKNRRNCLKTECREFVTQFVGGASEYWNISFAEDRLTATQTDFLAAARKCGIDSVNHGKMDGILKKYLPNDSDSVGIWLLGQLTEILADGLTE